MIMTAYLLAKRNGFKGDENAAPFNMKFFLRSCGNAGFALATPFIILGSIYTGWATPVEASVVAIVWALFVGIAKATMNPGMNPAVNMAVTDRFPRIA